MPEPLPKAAMRTSRTAPSPPADSSRAKAIFSTISVVRMACAASRKMTRVSAERGSKLGQRRDQLFRGQRNANDPGRRRKNLFGAAAEGLRSGGAGGARGTQPGLARGAVGIAGIDGHHAHTPAGRASNVCLSMMRGAAITRFEVNAAAALAGASATIRAKSGRPLAFRPAFAGSKSKAAGR